MLIETKKIKFLFSFILLVFCLLPSLSVMAVEQPHQTATDWHRDFITASGFAIPGTTEGANLESGITNIIALILSVVLSTLGAIFLILVLYAGILWMTAGGNQEQVTKAKKLLINATIGLTIVLSAYAITYIVMAWLGNAIGYDTGDGFTAPPAGSL
ncbi:MAG: hypothetical protein WC480_01385 [Patescibacteria group bacterium]